MLLRRHIPAPPLACFIEFFWYFEDWDGAHPMEQVLPDATFELVINLLDGPRKLFNRSDLGRYTTFRGGWLSGAHSKYIVIDTQRGSSMIGAHFKPGGVAPFLPTSAGAFHDQVVELEAIWGRSARELRERLLAAEGACDRFFHLEQFLLDLLRRDRIDPQRQERITWAVGQFWRQPNVLAVREAASRLNISHKHFITQFREQVGMSPKLFCRIRRFQEVLAQINARRRISWAEVACACGYYDQSHLVNDFQAFAGLNPSAYRSLDADYASFVPVGDAR
jgi:AraC-like DNA-binding protein